MNQIYEQPYNPNEFQPAYNQITEANISVYISRVMGWMFLGLLLTAITSIAALFVEPISRLVFGTGYGIFVVFGAQLAVVIGLNAGIKKMQPATATFLFLVYSMLTGLTMSTIYVMFEAASIATSFLITSLIFLMMMIVGIVTKKDLTRIGYLLMFGLFGVIAASVVNIFLGSSTFELIISVVGVLVFIGLIAFDAQKTKNLYISAVAEGHETDGPIVHKLAIIGALQLYLDFINLFLRLLRILGKRR